MPRRRWARSWSTDFTASLAWRCAARSGASWPVPTVDQLRKPLPPNERWSMDFMSERLEGGRYFRTLTIIDQFTRECLKLEVAITCRESKW